MLWTRRHLVDVAGRAGSRSLGCRPVSAVCAHLEWRLRLRGSEDLVVGECQKQSTPHGAPGAWHNAMALDRKRY